MRLNSLHALEFILWSNVSDTIWQVQAYKLLLYICIDFVALVSSYQFSFDFLVSLVSLIVSLTVFVTFSSYSIQSAEDCKSRFSNCKKYVLAQRYHILSFVLFCSEEKKPKIYFSQGYHYVCVPYNWAVSDNYNSQVFNTTLKSWT